MASSSVTRGSTVTLTGFPLIVSVIGTGPGPATLAGAGAATASLSSRPVPSAPPPRPTPLMNPRREKPAFGLDGGSGSFLELTGTFLSCTTAVIWMSQEAKSNQQIPKLTAKPCGAGNLACSRLSRRLDPLESGSAVWIARPTRPDIIVILHAALQSRALAHT